MSIEDRYRTYAAYSLELATKQAESADKSRLLLIAEAWLDLADRMARHLKPRARVDHPLVERALDLDQPGAG